FRDESTFLQLVGTLLFGWRHVHPTAFELPNLLIQVAVQILELVQRDSLHRDHTSGSEKTLALTPATSTDPGVPVPLRSWLAEFVGRPMGGRTDSPRCVYSRFGTNFSPRTLCRHGPNRPRLDDCRSPRVRRLRRLDRPAAEHAGVDRAAHDHQDVRGDHHAR